MKGYVKNALVKLNHIACSQYFYGPSKTERPNYGAKIQYAKENTSAVLTKDQIKYLQKY